MSKPGPSLVPRLPPKCSAGKTSLECVKWSTSKPPTHFFVLDTCSRLAKSHKSDGRFVQASQRVERLFWLKEKASRLVTMGA